MNSRPAPSGGYELRDQLFVWLLTDPAQPVLVGEIQLVRTRRGAVSFRYADSWLRHGFALSEDLPLDPQEFLPTDKDTAPGAVDDARPDRWGERVIRFLDKPPRLSLLEFLYFAGDDRFGALGVSTSADSYLPRTIGPLPSLADTAVIQELVAKVLSNEPIPAQQQRLISPGVTMGGARPKALIEIEGEPWIVKFSDGEPADTPLVEHASMTLARRAGIRTAETRALPLVDGHAVAVRRFDREGGRRLHALSANVALKAAGEEMGYPELAQLLRRRGVAQGGLQVAQMKELFRRMVFNILLDNTDDHEKNHVLLVDDAQHYRLAPAFDVLPAGQALGYQQMRVGTEAADSTLENALSMVRYFGLSQDQAVKEVREVAGIVAEWQAHFTACGVRPRDIELYAEQIDRPFLREQREEFAPA
ncbi:type II toxin-antitoxin system HipA family toxin [Aquabacterium sp. A7-Y]|uniref:type II toxin-antitoxin system HipA family toxin n=1 Tax=Aquabacterium sp. A7-Y TaxID=1349605 RepID=UPI00223D953D|nr:type II toxin-antitoxin system HipA family toxin [Aquabacterium sp. A7-Y]MCW7538446.1 type II toxin-antitoxin system HipA family toxin [Aquabacterium sp. A7-Y]